MLSGLHTHLATNSDLQGRVRSLEKEVDRLKGQLYKEKMSKCSDRDEIIDLTSQHIDSLSPEELARRRKMRASRPSDSTSPAEKRRKLAPSSSSSFIPAYAIPAITAPSFVSLANLTPSPSPSPLEQTPTLAGLDERDPLEAYYLEQPLLPPPPQTDPLDDLFDSL
jgi:hypothetical protein